MITIRRPDPFGDVERPPFPTAGPRVAWFIENHCCYSDGVLMGRLRRLDRWQRWILNEMYRIDPITGLRFWREFIEMVPRGNDKSGLISSLGFYHLLYDDEGAPEIYSAAKNSEQAGAVFNPAKIMWDFSPHLQALCNKYVGAIECGYNSGSWKPVSRIADTQQGKKPYILLNDEYHVHESSELRDTLIRGMTKRAQPLAIDITTEGKSRYSPLGSLQRDYYKAIEAGNGEHVEVHKYLHVYKFGRSCFVRWGPAWGEVDGIDPENPEIVAACNPGEWIDPYRLIDDQLKRPGSREADFITYHLNGLVENVGGEGVPMQMWDACAAPGVGLVDGQDVVLGIDAGYRRDCSAVVVVGKHASGRVVARSTIWKPPRDQGLELDLEATIGVRVEELLARYRVRRIVGDPALLVSLFQRWQGRGLPVREYRFGWGDTGPDSVRLLEAIQSGQLAHDGDVQLRLHVSNMRVKDGPNGMWRYHDHPDKRMPDSDVPNDAGIALMLAVGELVGGERSSNWRGRGLLVV